MYCSFFTDFRFSFYIHIVEDASDNDEGIKQLKRPVVVSNTKTLIETDPKYGKQ